MRTLFIALTAVVLFATSLEAAEVNPRVQGIQEGLIELGYDVGKPDGILGPSTQEAIRVFQRDHKMEPDGKLSGPLLFRIQLEVSEARRSKTPEGRTEAREKARLLAKTTVELIEEIEGASVEEMEEIFSLIGDRRDKLPLSILIGKINLPRGSMDLILQPLLGELQYQNTGAGIRQFQEDIGETPTGDITLGQVEELERRATRHRDRAIYADGLGDRLVIIRVEGHLEVRGTWILEGEKIALPINTARIRCSRQKGECESIQAEVLIPSLSEKGEHYLLNLGISTYEIVSWNAVEVIARDERHCRTALLTINSNSTEVFEVTRNNETKNCLEGTLDLMLPRLDKPKIARLVPGYDATSEWWKMRNSETDKYTSSRFQKRKEDIIEAMREQSN